MKDDFAVDKVTILKRVATQHNARTAPGDCPCYRCVVDSVFADENVIACRVTVQHDSACPLSDVGAQSMDSCLCEHVDLTIEAQYT